MGTIDHYINGRRVRGQGVHTTSVTNPATGAMVHDVPIATDAEVDQALGAARDALPGWRSTPLGRRSEVLFRMREVLHAHREELAELVTGEHGKVRADALGEVARGLENVEFACGVPSLMKGSFSEQASTGVDVYSIRQPVGTVVGISPFNFPVMVPMWMFANAIAAGNTFVLKPSEKDPSVSVRMAELLSEAGVPDGVFNVVQGDRHVVDALITDERVDAISFVGSTPVAASVHDKGTKLGKRVQALAGAKNHMVVLPDADVGMAADAAVSAAYGSAGERCMAVSVVVGVGAVSDELRKEIEARLPGITIGDGMDPCSEMGPLISEAHRDRVASYIDGAAAQGATVVVDGRTHPKCAEAGFFLGASLIDGVTPVMDCYRDEIFGPVLCVVRVDTFEEAVALVNDNRWGNGAAIFTRDGGAAQRFQSEALAGMIGVNVPIPVPVGYYSFGGWKDSLFGESRIYGPEGVDFYTRTKVVTSRWPDPATSGVNLGFPQTR